MALSMSPLTSVSAFLQSDMPAPVRSRRSLIIVALISIELSPFRSRLLCVRGGRCLRVEHAAARRHLDARTITTRRHVNHALALVLTLLATVASGLLPDLRTDDRGVGDARREQLDRADRVVVTGDDVIDPIRIAVGIGDRDDRNLELARLVDGNVLLVRVDHEQ